MATTIRPSISIQSGGLSSAVLIQDIPSANSVTSDVLGHFVYVTDNALTDGLIFQFALDTTTNRSRRFRPGRSIRKTRPTRRAIRFRSYASRSRRRVDRAGSVELSIRRRRMPKAMRRVYSSNRPVRIRDRGINEIEAYACVNCWIALMRHGERIFGIFSRRCPFAGYGRSSSSAAPSPSVAGAKLPLRLDNTSSKEVDAYIDGGLKCKLPAGYKCDLQVPPGRYSIKFVAHRWQGLQRFL